jgi:hypothetical protein
LSSAISHFINILGKAAMPAIPLGLQNRYRMEIFADGRWQLIGSDFLPEPVSQEIQPGRTDKPA